VYLLPTPHLTTLSSVPSRILAPNGAHGQGSWQNGKSAPPHVIQVPLGTVVRELPRHDSRRAKDEWEAEEEGLKGLESQIRRERMRAARWLHYPLTGDANHEKEPFIEAEAASYAQERARRIERRKRELERQINLDLDREMDAERDVDAPLGIRQQEPLGYLIASGGQGGQGNPHFITTVNRSPKFAQRGQEGERITLEMELKILADIGLVGMPNAGKSTLLRALTGGRVKSEVANYAFTTLNPIIGVVRMAKDGVFEGELASNGTQERRVYEETTIETTREWEKMVHGDYAHALTRNQKPAATLDGSTSSYRPGHGFDLAEDFRFTVADNPGLIAQASENVGLGHEFLRSMERSLALVYVVDLSSPAPWEELVVLRNELEAYMPGMSSKTRMVIANKADLLVGQSKDPSATQEQIDEAKAKLKRLEDFVKAELDDLNVVPISAKYGQNLSKVVSLMRTYVQDATGRTK
jgi:GTP-binding protein